MEAGPAAVVYSTIMDFSIGEIFGAIITAIEYLFLTWYIWVPIVLFYFTWNLWMTYIRTNYIHEQGSTLLEIKLPREILKSPAAMELVFTQLYQKGSPKNLFETYWDGKIPPWFSFELASFGGEIHFYIWTPTKFKDLIEAQIYAQYPTVEIYEVEDYTRPVTHDKYEMWGTYFKLTDPDPYPIKTYVDYGLDKDPKEEFKIEPMNTMLEYLGSLKKGEQVWIQILITAHQTGWIKEGYLFPKKDWRPKAEAEVKKIKDKATTKVEGSDFPGFPNYTENQKKKIDAIERSLGKFAFDTAIRAFYIADDNEAFRPISITGLIGSTRQFNSNELNGFKLGYFTDTAYPFQDFRGKVIPAMKKSFLEAYKLRSFFQKPYKHMNQKPLVLTTEELATMYHFPGQIATTPTFTRIPSRKAEPPSNLPT